MTKTFYFDMYSGTFKAAALRLINKMGWEIISSKELETVEETIKVTVVIPEEDINIFELAFGDIL